MSCKKKVDIDNVNAQFSCPFCSGKILFKLTPEVVKTIKAK